MKAHVVAYEHRDRQIVLAQLEEATFHVTCYEGHYPTFDRKNLIHIEAMPFAPF